LFQYRVATTANPWQVEGLDGAGEKVSWTASDWSARIVQHEMDHLAGTLITGATCLLDRMFFVTELNPSPLFLMTKP
jgi:peptide deformylase